MRKSFEFKRIDGKRCQIGIEFLFIRERPYYRVSVSVCEPKKRTFKQIDVTDNYIYRGLSFGGKEREEFVMNEYLKHVSTAEILHCKIQVWEMLNPSLL